MLTKNNWRRKAVAIVPITLLAGLLMTACGGTTAPNTAVPPTTIPTVATAMQTPTTMTAVETPTTMTAVETATTMMGAETPTTMMGAETPTTMMGAETPGALVTPGGMMNAMTVTMNALNGSGESGTATFTGQGVLTLNLTSTTTEPQPAHIHSGTCANLGAVVVPLTNVVGGKSDTSIPATFSLTSGQAYAINVHKSAAEVSTYVSCGDIGAGMMSTPGMTGSTPGMTGTTPVATP